MSKAPIIIEGQADARGLGCHLGSGWFLRPCCCCWDLDSLGGLHCCLGQWWHPDPAARLGPWSYCSWDLCWSLLSLLPPKVPWETYSLSHNMWLYWCPWAMPQPGPSWSEWFVLPPGALAAGKGPVRVHGPTAVGVYIDVCDPCYQRESQEPSPMKSEGHAGQALPFAGRGENGPAPHWILQLAPTLTESCSTPTLGGRWPHHPLPRAGENWPWWHGAGGLIARRWAILSIIPPNKSLSKWIVSLFFGPNHFILTLTHPEPRIFWFLHEGTERNFYIRILLTWIIIWYFNIQLF